MKAFLISAAAGLIGLASTAVAAPVYPTTQYGTSAQHGNSALILAQFRDHNDHHGHHGQVNRHHHGQRFVPGRRYHSAPHGWHRYSRRPGDWRTRGCITVGPVWFCP